MNRPSPPRGRDWKPPRGSGLRGRLLCSWSIRNAKTYVSAEQSSPCQNPWLPGADEIQGRAGRAGAPQGQRPLEADGQRRAGGPLFELAINIAAGKGISAFPKSVRLLRSSDFRRVYAGGFRITGPYFAAFCLRRPDAGGAEATGASRQGPRIGLTVPRALGKSVVRNRIKRRIREAVRRQLRQLEPRWEIVINPRRAALTAPFEDLAREIQRLFSRCKG